jgi:tRNA dimethylallyltransferase
MSVDAVLIAGPTASGKSTAALELAERIGGALINTDSMQVYREARILTARPDEVQMARAPHVLYGHVSVHAQYDVARYVSDAKRALNDARSRGLVPILVGGTGLYFDALTRGLPHMPRIPQTIRDATRARREELGAEQFFSELSVRDPETASRLPASDAQRVLRAYEVFEATGIPLAHWQKGERFAALADLSLARFVLLPPRPELHRRIETRFDAMLEAGAAAEADRLKDIDRALPAAKILGLRELNAARTGEVTLEGARSAALTATRQYAKRQATWFRNRMGDWHFIDSGGTCNIILQVMQFVA